MDSIYDADDLYNKIQERAFQTGSDALYIKQGENVLFGNGKVHELIHLQSITKSITSLAIGILIDQKQISSIDEPVWKFFPEWKHGNKERVLIRHLLTHTSGLAQDENSMRLVSLATDCVQFALNSECSEPGKDFLYNNIATNILSGIVEKASEQRLDLFLKDKLFTPLGIAELSWTLDPAGHAYVMGELRLKAIDVAKIGKLILQRGKWEDKQVISSSWIDQSMKRDENSPSQSGLLWWPKSQSPLTYMAQGYMGQYLVVIPESNLVGVRLVHYKEALAEKGDFFDDFPDLLIDLSRRVASIGKVFQEPVSVQQLATGE